jgi:hypothetical protein
MAHNMNPFDFVPFPEHKPVTKPAREWLKEGKLLTGWIEAQITALTPLHIVGRQEVDGSGHRITRSHFYRRHGQAYIPSTSIRGMLRAFIEAACNGWASQITPYYPYVKGTKQKPGRQIGFQALDSKKLLSEKDFDTLIDDELKEKLSLPDGFAMPQKLAKEQLSNLPVDLASFLFGYIPPEGDGFHGRISIEDAEVPLQLLSFNEAFNVPDINDSAFMGGGKPSAASWWYQKPYQIRINQYGMPVFVGLGYRGRKFYYHQNPQSCIPWYSDDHNWPYDGGRPLYEFPLECLMHGKPTNTTNTFRIYFEDLPEAFLTLLLFALSPGKRMCHKLGYGKPYGYGTVAVEVLSGMLRSNGYAGKTDFDAKAKQAEIHAALWNKSQLDTLGIGQYLHWKSLESLAKILLYSEKSTLIFSYPRFNPGYQITDQSLISLKNEGLSEPLLNALAALKDRKVCTEKDLFDEIWNQFRLRPKDEKKLIREHAFCVPGGFLPTVQWNRLRTVLGTDQQAELNTEKRLEVTEAEAKTVARKLADKGLRPALHFEVYQERAEGYGDIKKRKLEDAK